mgnify:CR=1 FL=1
MVSDACQINDFDHSLRITPRTILVSDACQINDFDHQGVHNGDHHAVSDACQINDFDHYNLPKAYTGLSFRCLSDQ